MTTLAKWQEEELARIAALGNKALLDETIELASGDDYDGCFSPRGRWTYEQLHAELYRRLADWFAK